MIFLGITGGVGAGKSLILSYLEEHYQAKILLADELAKDLLLPGTSCNEAIREAFAEDMVFHADGSVDREAMARLLFSDDEKRYLMNSIVHPAVKEEVLRQVSEARDAGEISILVLEAALLIEENYTQYLDSLVYIYCPETKRRDRLKETRGYSDSKITDIFNSQLSDEEFRRAADYVIDNSKTKEEAYASVDRMMDWLLEGKKEK